MLTQDAMAIEDDMQGNKTRKAKNTLNDVKTSRSPNEGHAG
jgi:hypothetical protein